MLETLILYSTLPVYTLKWPKKFNGGKHTNQLFILFPPDPDIPNDFEVTSWNSSSISLAWAAPDNRKFSLFLLTTFYLNGTDHVTKEVPLWHKEDNFVFTLSGLQPCSRVKFGLQAVCQAGMESRYSKMVLNDGNSRKSSTS